MPSINLLPWREKIREERKKEFLQLWVGCVALTCFFMVLVHGGIAHQIKKQRVVNATLQSEINRLELKIIEVRDLKKERASLLSRMQVIEQLQRSRPLTVKIFDSITRLMPEGVYLTEFSRSGDQFNMKGRAESNTRVSEFMRALAQSSHFSAPQLTEIKTDKSEEVYKSAFELHCAQQSR